MNESPWATLASAITRLTDRVDALPSIREATVDSAFPLSVRFDTDPSGVNVHGSLVSGLASGDRVLTLKLRHYIWVLGRKGGGTVARSLGTENLNDLTTPGLYTQATGGNATTTRNYPRNGTLGLLEVLSGPDGAGSQGLQRYTARRGSQQNPIWERRFTQTDDGAFFSAWVALTEGAQIASGSVNITPVANDPLASAVTVTFPSGRFSDTPVVVVSANSSATAFRSVRVGGISTSGCTIWLERTNTTTTTVYWQAINSI